MNFIKTMLITIIVDKFSFFNLLIIVDKPFIAE